LSSSGSYRHEIDLADAKSVLIEAVRRKEIYVIVLLAMSVIAGDRIDPIFRPRGMSKFYREVSLKIMNLATALTVIVLAAASSRASSKQGPSILFSPNRSVVLPFWRQIPRRFPGRLLLLRLVYRFVSGGMKFLGASLHLGVLVQAVYLQILALAHPGFDVLHAVMLLNVDAAITVSVLMFGLGESLSSAIDLIYDSSRPSSLQRTVGPTSLGALFIQTLNYTIRS